MGQDKAEEAILEPDLPIIDPHHHLWDLRPLISAFPAPRHFFIETLSHSAYYTFDQLLADARGGHNVIATVYMECGAFYRAGVDPAMKPVGEVEFAGGVAAQGASGLYGNFRPCSAIVGHADLTLGDGARPVLEALAAAGNGRFRGIRHQGAWNADPDVLGPPFHAPPQLYLSDKFRQGFRHLGEMGLTFDAWVLEPQLGDVLDLARAFPDQPICLDHCGTPLGMGIYLNKLHERFDIWRENIHALAACPNVSVKLGGLAMAFCGLPDHGPMAGLSSETLAAMWRPYIETCIEAFGPDRAMFESNYPVDKWGASYNTLWNAFKRLAHGASASEKRALFAGTAAKFYGIEDTLP
ncbi:MAG: amidohydrolase [Novosphingobium sp. 28-62-57]|uniref:amidohydrolase family protein n=1 Tax=unclassified Novosphingobium TaxID=2644732 RepID=UPI000BCD8F2F|nr:MULTISPECIES: amidohydrolase family protein [unclassified Novosphingobium]OYW48932.1 MAG: amidohydrolase [Novosphingobium sp. 12-62-10]OYZ12662.1 MAG: amidohydrolase [Novosphingobium sp. 28-62-57]OZA39669.1 MAG: amidohydrolase [Novosphingobium sp. 17-62-9]